jgi:tetratricopeptide (TPR) repeat protein
MPRPHIRRRRLDDDAKARARAAFLAAHDLAMTGHLDGLAIDALHMMAFVDTAPDRQLRWGQRALEIAVESTQPAAKRWEPSLRNNIGYALHQLGRYDEALAEFRQARLLRERAGDAGALRDARWMEAWTLRALKRIDEAIAIQTRLETEYAACRRPEPRRVRGAGTALSREGRCPAGDALRRAQGHGTALRGGSSKRRPKSRSTTTARCCQRCRSSFDFERARRPGTLPAARSAFLSSRAAATPVQAAAVGHRDLQRRSAATPPPAGRRPACSSRTRRAGRPR